MLWLKAWILLGLILTYFSPAFPYSQADPYNCKPNAIDKSDEKLYPVFEKDYEGVTQVCPAYIYNFSTDTKDFKSTGPLYIVIHNTGNPSDTAVDGNIDWFQNPSKGVSAHYIVGLNKSSGAVDIIQMVPESNMAYHAGNDIPLDGNVIVSNNSIGIEVVGQGDLADWPSEKVYLAVANLVKDIVRRAKDRGREIELTRKYIVGHEEISIDGKWDPGQRWDWKLFMEKYLGGKYMPAAALQATRNSETNEISFSITARNNARDQYRFEIREDDGDFRKADELNAVDNTANFKIKNPGTYKLTSYKLKPLDTPKEICYRVFAYRNDIFYRNPSTEACVNAGPVGSNYDRVPRRDSTIDNQIEYPIVRPSEQVNITITFRNAGMLSWKPGGQYVLINTGGESFGLETKKPVSKQIMPGDPVSFELPFQASKEEGVHTSIWQMAYIEKTETGEEKIDLFGKEAGVVVTILPKNSSKDLEQLIRQFIEQAIKNATQPLNDYLVGLGEKIQKEIDRLTPWWLKCLSPLSLSGIVFCTVLFTRKRKGRG